ncbi:MATE family efflux transporter [Roseivirga misakiensis]|uniref:Multidrug-efflux transporter n=1 Tax=Roseivirga misakiensis TaxID=1563681 RepID=A0A1E5SKJ1_9BACT|nr:MATE family efflux transporter [Roseivirga misakiensis]OEJ99648.1 MATE family efflux transporter [Roseivirga misakiensis]
MEQLSYKSHLNKTLRLAYPVMLSQLGHILVGIVDSIMVGQIGPSALAASAFANNFLGVFLMFGIGVSYGITPLVAQADGKSDSTKIIRLLRHGIILCSLVGLLLFLILYGTSSLFPLMNQPEEVVALGTPYFIIISSSLIPLMIFQNFRQFAEGLSITKPTMYITIAANLINVLLNYLLIYGKFGFPELGLNGAGWATFISRVLMAIALGVFVFRFKQFHAYRPAFNLSKIKVGLFRPILKLGVPSGIQFVFEVGAFAMASIMMGWLGTKPLAAHQIAISLVALSYMMATGIAAASTVRIGNQIGARDGYNLQRVGNTSFLMSLVFMACCALVFVVFNKFFPTLYIQDKEVIQIASALIIVAGFFQLSDGVQVVGLGVLRGMSDVKAPTVITLIAYWGIAIPASYCLGFVFDLGPEGIWYGLLIGLTVAALSLFFRFRKLAAKKALDFMK